MLALRRFRSKALGVEGNGKPWSTFRVPPHPRISLILPLHGVSYQQVRTYAAAAQAAGVSGLWFPDHLINETRPDRGVLECWTALAAVAATTEELPIGPLVLTTALRNPTLLAKQVATLDAIAPGRLRLGLGAGGLTYADTCKAYGLAELTPGETRRALRRNHHLHTTSTDPGAG